MTLSERLLYRVGDGKLSYTERFERDAERFYRETGFMAPGKSVPLEMGGSNYDEEREAAWRVWTDGEKAQFYTDLEAAAQVCKAAEDWHSTRDFNGDHGLVQGLALDAAVQAGKGTPR